MAAEKNFHDKKLNYSFMPDDILHNQIETTYASDDLLTSLSGSDYNKYLRNRVV